MLLYITTYSDTIPLIYPSTPPIGSSLRYMSSGRSSSKGMLLGRNPGGFTLCCRGECTYTGSHSSHPMISYTKSKLIYNPRHNFCGSGGDPKGGAYFSIPILVPYMYNIQQQDAATCWEKSIKVKSINGILMHAERVHYGM